jgi:hypothetical protein
MAGLRDRMVRLLVPGFARRPISKGVVMNRRFIVFCQAIATAAILGVTTATPASAETALPEWSPPSAVTLTMGKELISLEGAKVACERSTGVFSAGTRLGTFSIDTRECLVKDEPCTGLGQTSGLIEVRGEWHLVRLLKSPLHYEILLLFGPDNGSDIHLECVFSGELFLIWDGILALIVQLTPHTAELHFSTEGGGVTIKETNREYLNNSGETITLELLGKIDSSAERVVGITEENAFLSSATATTIKLP